MSTLAFGDIYQSRIGYAHPICACLLTGESRPECKASIGKKCTEHVTIAVVLSFLLGAVTGILVVLIAYLHRTKQLCFKTKDKAESTVDEDATVDVKFSSERTLSTTSIESINGTVTKPAISESLTDKSQYETLSSDAKQSETYDALKHETMVQGHHKLAGHTSTDSNHQNRNWNENLQDSNVNNIYFIQEKDNVWKNHSRRKRRPSTTYETIEIGNRRDGYPVSVKRVIDKMGSAQDVPFSGDMSAGERGSHTYFTLEAVQDINSNEGIMDASTRRKTDSPDWVTKVQPISGSTKTDSPDWVTKVQPISGSTLDLFSGGKCTEECNSHDYVVLKASEDANWTENTKDICTPRETDSPISKTCVESVGCSPHEISFSCDKSAYDCFSHDYFILEKTEYSNCKRNYFDPYTQTEIDDETLSVAYHINSQNEAESRI
ncbi:hypothetical protein ACJMK2_016813 [Sinanodonta woodiana]|uniref:Uncharacterized protein n=1 Tax=Sinanodonta woodiana TaxID=1069815 RepID=A0ABD3UY12_SINWO